MHLKISPDLEKLIERRLSSGGYTSVEDVSLRALEAQDAQARREIHAMKDASQEDRSRGSVRPHGLE